MEHCRFTTQPIEEPEIYEQLIQALHMIQADRTVMFATDYPHWDNDTPKFVLNRLPDHLKKRIAYENAAEIYGL
jgi:predicted TIM-barrel fold metal-dependent hydrolase